MFKLEYKKISQTQEPDSAVLIFHGYGDSKHGFLDFAQELSLKFPKAAFYVTNAPEELVFGGYSWFHLGQEDFEAFEDPERALPTLNNLIARAPLQRVHELTKEISESESISSDKIFYIGFSQGGIMAMASGVTYDEKIGGVVAMSAVPLTFGESFGRDKVKNSPDTLLTHSTDDMVVPFVCFSESKKSLLEIGANIDELVISRAGHNESVSTEVYFKIIEFMNSRI